MTHDDFFGAVKAGALAPAYLFGGEEEHIKESALRALRAKVLPKGLEALNETILMNPPADAVIAAAETLPVMADRRLVLIRDSALLTSGKAAGEAEDSARLAAYLPNVPPTTTLIFYVRGKPDGRKKLTQALVKAGAAVQFDRLSDAQLQKWIAIQFRQQGKAVAPGDAALLAFTVGHDLLTLAQEIAKVAAFAGERADVTRGDIEAVAAPSLECTVFQMVDALVAGKEAEALRLLSVMLEAGEARIGILAMMARQYRHLLHVKLMQQAGVSEGEMQKRLGVPSFALRRLKVQAARADAASLREKLDLCVDTDYAIKSGRMREDAALERAIFRLCS